jgi:hypothetical protein
MVWSSLCTRGNKACGILIGSFIVKTMGSDLGEACQKAIEDPLVLGEAPRLSTELPHQELGPYKGILARGSNED